MQPRWDFSQPPFNAIERLPVPALVAGPNGEYVYANPAACTLLGMPLDEVAGRSIAEFVLEGFDFEAAWAQFLRDGALEGEVELRGARGALTVRFNAIRDFSPGCHLSILVDITDRKRIESSVRRSEELYSRAFNLTPAPTNIRRLANGVFVDVNQAFTETLGYWRADVLGRTAQTIGLWNNPDQLAAILDELRAGTNLIRARATLVDKGRAQREFSVAVRRAEIFGEPHAVFVYTDIATT